MIESFEPNRLGFWWLPTQLAFPLIASLNQQFFITALSDEKLVFKPFI
jgi:hypothetical protein